MISNYRISEKAINDFFKKTEDDIIEVIRILHQKK